jgi:hypothetical protein
VTVTLPDRTLDQLKLVDADRAVAIVKAVDAVLRGRDAEYPQAEIVEVAEGTGVVVLPPSKALSKLPWLRMIEVAPAQQLITIDPGTPVEKVEVAILDLIEVARGWAPEEVPMLETLRLKIGDLRRRERISKAELLFVTTNRH